MPDSKAALRIAIFAKAPIAGQAKTRLIPLLGAEGAAQLQAHLIERAVAKACALPGARVTLWVAGGIDHPFVVRCAADAGIGLTEQQGADLGARMTHAFAQAGGPLLLIGTDCPALTVSDLEQAAQALRTHDVVVQPAEDGGYVLIGLTRPQPALFEGIAWGGARVMDATRERIAALGLRACELASKPDLDTAADYARALAQGWLRP
jgi:hypothetical protein